MKTRSELTTRIDRRSHRAAWLFVALGAATAGWLLYDKDNSPNDAVHAPAKSDKSAALTRAVRSTSPDRAERQDAIGAHANEHSIDHPLEPFAALPEAAEQPEPERPHSHPIDDKRRRIYRENTLNAAMMGAMNVGDYLGLRELIDEYRVAYPEDEFRLQAGYSIVADCLERLTSERQSDARAYWQNNRGSIVRRFIRRHCLEKPVVNG